jgi:hypothetical protein
MAPWSFPKTRKSLKLLLSSAYETVSYRPCRRALFGLREVLGFSGLWPTPVRAGGVAIIRFFAEEMMPRGQGEREVKGVAE